MEKISSWDHWVEEALSKLQSLRLLRSIRPIYLRDEQQNANTNEFEVFDEMRPWDRASVEVEISEATFQEWLHDFASPGDEVVLGDDFSEYETWVTSQRFIKLTLFSGNSYLGLSQHPAVKKASVKAAQEHGMGPRGSALVCGYTNYHRRLESCLADLKKKEDCLLCPTGYSANMALMVTLGNVGSILASDSKALDHDRVAIFSDSLNHASIIDGIHLAQRQHRVEVFVYRHCDMTHLDSLLSNCKMRKKVVVTDSLFSMDGDFAPLTELVKLRKKYGFLLVIDDAHGTFICGKNGGGLAEELNCEGDIDISVGTLSKAAGCLGGFITCSKNWKQLIQSRGRSFIFTTSIPVPLAAAGHAAVMVARKETWRRKAIWNRVEDFRALTGIPITSPIISLIVGSEVKALEASRHLLRSGFHVIAIRPPTVPPNSCRLRVTLCASHTRNDLKRLTDALSSCINFEEIGNNISIGYARL